MGTLGEERFNVCSNHPDHEQIFYLEKMLIEAGYPYFFNFWEKENPESIDWNTYNFLIEVGMPAGRKYADISVRFNQEGIKKLLELLDMRPAEGKEGATESDGELHRELAAEQVMEIIEKFFDSL